MIKYNPNSSSRVYFIKDNLGICIYSGGKMAANVGALHSSWIFDFKEDSPDNIVVLNTENYNKISHRLNKYFKYEDSL